MVVKLREIILANDDDDSEDVSLVIDTKERKLIEKLKSPSSLIRMSVITSAGATPNVLKAALDLGPGDETIKVGAVRHKNANRSVILKGIKDPSPLVQEASLESPYVDSEILSIALKSTNSSVRKTAISKDIVSTEDLLNALDDVEIAVRVAAVNNPSSNKAVLRKAMSNDNLIVRQWAVSHKNADLYIFMQGLKDADPEVRRRAAKRIEALRSKVRLKD